jgi:hypothetical protein
VMLLGHDLGGVCDRSWCEMEVMRDGVVVMDLRWGGGGCVGGGAGVIWFTRVLFPL